MRKCKHPQISQFIAFQGKNGERVWRCSHCGKEDVWKDGWQRFGPVECRCGDSGTEAVVCSDACATAYKPDDPELALELARLRHVRQA